MASDWTGAGSALADINILTLTYEREISKFSQLKIKDDNSKSEAPPTKDGVDMRSFSFKLKWILVIMIGIVMKI